MNAQTPEPVSFDAPVVERGVGFFETLLLVGRRAVMWDSHVSRLLATLSRLELPAPDVPRIREAAERAVTRARAVDAEPERALRLAWIAVGQELDSPESWRLDVSVRRIPDTTQKRRDGCDALTLPPELHRDTPSVKSTSYFAPVVGLRLAKRQHCDEGLFVSPEGCYLEGTSTALVAFDGERREFVAACGGALPSVTAGLLLGTQPRTSCLTAALLRHGGALLGSLTKGAPLRSLDGKPCEIPDLMRSRLAEFNERLIGDPALGVEL